MPELNVRSLCFIPSIATPTLAILYSNHKEECRIVARSVLLEEKEISWEPIFDIQVQDEAYLIVPIPGSPPGIVILGGGKCAYYSCSLVAQEGKPPQNKGKDPETLPAGSNFVEVEYPYGRISTSVASYVSLRDPSILICLKDVRQYPRMVLAYFLATSTVNCPFYRSQSPVRREPSWR